MTMNYLKIFFCFLLVGSFTLAAQAQRGRTNMSLEERAEKQTERMTKQLGLSDAQSAKVQELNLKYGEKIKEVRDNADGDREAMRANLETLQTERNAELKTLLTEAQYASHLKTEAERRQRFSERRGARKGGKKGAPKSDEAPAAAPEQND